MLQQSTIDQFRGQLRGELIEPSDARYEEARKVYNAMISRKPRLIALCADVADVITAVRFGRENRLAGFDPRRRTQRRRARGLRRRPGHRSVPYRATSTSIRRHRRCASEADAHGARSITPRTPLDWPSRRGLSPLPGSAG